MDLAQSRQILRTILSRINGPAAQPYMEGRAWERSWPLADLIASTLQTTLFLQLAFIRQHLAASSWFCEVARARQLVLLTDRLPDEDVCSYLERHGLLAFMECRGIFAQRGTHLDVDDPQRVTSAVEGCPHPHAHPPSFCRLQEWLLEQVIAQHRQHDLLRWPYCARRGFSAQTILFPIVGFGARAFLHQLILMPQRYGSDVSNQRGVATIRACTLDGTQYSTFMAPTSAPKLLPLNTPSQP